MKYSITVSRLVQTYPYENLEIILSQEYDDYIVPRDAGFIEVRDKINEWITAESKRSGRRSPGRRLCPTRVGVHATPS